MRITSVSVIKKSLVILIVVGALYYSQNFLIPLAIGGVLSTLFLPFCRWMERKKIPRWMAVTLCLLVFLLFVSGIVFVLIWQMSELTNDFILLKETALAAGARLQEYIFNHLGIPAEKQTQMLKNEQPLVAVMVKKMAGSLTYIFTSFILVLAYIFMLLYYRGHLRYFVLKLIPSGEHREMDQVLRSIAHVSQQYMVGLSKMIGLLWVMYCIGFSALGVKNPLFFAILCGLLEIIPFIGNITGTSFTVVVAAVQGGSNLMLLGIVSTYIFVQFIQGWILEPMILGPQVKINPFATIVALVVGELLWGIPGVFLAIPLIAMVKIVCDHVESLKPYGFLFGKIKHTN